MLSKHASAGNHILHSAVKQRWSHAKNAGHLRINGIEEAKTVESNAWVKPLA